MNAEREASATAAFVAIANSLVDGHDPVDLLTGLTADCVRLLDIASAGLLLADPTGVLHLMAASSDRTREVELFQLQREQGPCLDSYHGGTPVLVPDLADASARWPQFVGAARAAGFASVHAVPMRLPQTVLGVLGLFGTSPGALNPEDLALAQGLAHVAAIALVVERAAADKSALNLQLQTALRSRVVIEQAKGFLAQRGDLPLERAFDVLRAYARGHNERISELAQQVVSRTVDAEILLAYQPAARTSTHG